MSSATKLQQQIRQFLQSQQFAVAGASKDSKKFGYKVLNWYIQKGKKVTPIHPTEASILNVACVSSLAKLQPLPPASSWSLSVITPPPITNKVLEEATRLGIRHIWCQPGASDASSKACIEAHLKTYPDAIVLHGGPCILRDTVGMDVNAKM